MENENQHLTEENSKMKSSLKQGSKSSNEDIGKLKDKIKRLERQIIDKDKNNSNIESINEIKLGTRLDDSRRKKL